MKNERKIYWAFVAVLVLVLLVVGNGAKKTAEEVADNFSNYSYYEQLEEQLRQ